MQQDSTSVYVPTPVTHQDSLSGHKAVNPVITDSIPVSHERVITTDSFSTPVAPKKTTFSSAEIKTPKITSADTSTITNADTQKNPIHKIERNFDFTYVLEDSFLYAVKPEPVFKNKNIVTSSSQITTKMVHHRPKNEGWLLPVILISLIIIIWVKLYYQRFLNQVIQSVVNYRLSLKLLREKNIIIRRLFMLLNLHFVIIVSLFLFFCNQKFNVLNNLDGITGFGIIFLGVSIFNLSRYILQKIAAYIFDCTPVVKEYLHNVYLINKNIGLFLLPLTIVAVYIDPPVNKFLLVIGLLALSLSVLYQFIRGFMLILKKGILLFYSILYFCTLEILPVLLGTKFLMSLS